MSCLCTAADRVLQHQPFATASAPTVFKLGGSLLDVGDLGHRLMPWLCAVDQPVLFVGGGAAADLVRVWQPQFGFSDATAHELAMESLSLTATLMHRLLDWSSLCAHPAAVREAWRDRRLPIVLPRPWFEHSPGWFCGEPRLNVGLLPRSWETTSDTLAAAVAVDLGAEQLVLLKSVDLPPHNTLGDVTAVGAVDPWCPVVARLIPRVWWVNLRSDESREPKMISIGASSPSG